MEVGDEMSIFSAMNWMQTHRRRPEFGEPWQSRRTPVQLQTENGFAMVRRSDLEGKSSIDGTEHCFVVRDPYGYELDITVDFSEASIGEVIRRSRGSITLASAYWINRAERHLADYLWENDDYPPDGKITVDYLTPDDLDLARRWKSGVPRELVTIPKKFRPTKISTDGDGPKPKPQPIRFLTENGYSIVRLAEVNPSVSDRPQECHFRVTNLKGSEREITVRFDEALTRQIQSRRRRVQLTAASKFWPVIAEKYLADYVWRQDQFPTNDELIIDQLSDDDLLLGAHWHDQDGG